MPFHIHGSQMNGFPPPHLLPSSSHLSLLLSFPFFLPPSSHCSGQLPSITVTGRPQHRVWGGGGGGVGGESLHGGRGGEGGGDVYMDVMRGGDSRWHTSARYMFTGVFICVWACVAVSVPGALVCLCDMPMGQLLATHHGCCCNGTVTTTVWHLWRINIFHLEWSYYPRLVAAKIYIYKKAEKIMTPAAMIVGIRL